MQYNCGLQGGSFVSLKFPQPSVDTFEKCTESIKPWGLQSNMLYRDKRPFIYKMLALL